ncbi:DEHA2F00440p [Debaryomyces hansenii CBS767]|uniref:DEHA2F00440p n=1 Tax=Debaryomyces hansenii (strain ATCC 36239 / CBS 767 / BCRC 21394 / JCM 1990 / NBRC 0083 / IGC 2968) TaxID=284592 RepID=Q6BN40_DEBHA|nr:DEHA2F00440p [Debaryomyces hansenii CBS767]CAG88682.2 DEHA2F00440p [Debaryomyces hansenii CBS767]|eukprot:XP_460380.2 DEHA2F00440p [Debaryomyces hansenii CBS767]
MLVLVAGFGNGSRIIIDFTFIRYLYDGDTESLREAFLGSTNVVFEIELGYSSDQFNDNVVIVALQDFFSI